MDTNGVVDVVVGLVLMYLLLGLVCTMVNEFVSQFLKLRARNLDRAIEGLIDDPEFRRAWRDNALVKSLGRMSGRGGPSYLSATTFANAVVWALDPARPVAGSEGFEKLTAAIGTLPEGSNIRASLEQLAGGGADAVDAFRERIAGWFDDAMDRAAGVYKRNLQTLSLVIALLLVVLLNADTIAVTEQLWSDSALRLSIAHAAEMTVSEAGAEQPALDRVSWQELATLPIGWDFEPGPADGGGWFGTLLLKVVGLLLTALAVSLGAPFWFDVLSRFVRLRSSGGKPKAAGAAAAS
jgi:hypothetical protein